MLISSPRRTFLKSLGLGSFSLAVTQTTLADSVGKNVTATESRSVEEKRPGEIINAVKKGAFAFIPVSPMIEWHSYHLPVGTDGLISEAVARGTSRITGGIWFRPLSFGLDAWRNEEELKKWGFRKDDKVFGMNFPDVPLASEYCETAEMIAALKNRLKILDRMNIKHAFIINHHGGKGQFKTIENVARECTTGKLTVHAIRTYQFNDLTNEDGFYGVGGHAGFSETLWLMAFRPELVDLSTLMDGELSVREMGILHDKPDIDAKWNPKNVSLSVARKLKDHVLRNFSEYVLALK